MTAKLYDFATAHDAKVAAQIEPATFERPVRLLSLDIFAPAKPGQPHRAAVIDADLAGAQSTDQVLEQYAVALEEIAASFRAAKSRAG